MNPFNHASSVKNSLSHESRFSEQIFEETESKILDVLKCNDGVLSIRGKLIWQSDARSPQSCSQSLWDAIVESAIDSVTVSVWEEHFSKVKENNCCYITNMKQRSFNSVSLHTAICQIFRFRFFSNCV